jgi:hypothetical protein
MKRVKANDPAAILGFSKELSTYRTFGYFTKAIEFAMRIFLYHLVLVRKRNTHISRQQESSGIKSNQVEASGVSCCKQMNM